MLCLIIPEIVVHHPWMVDDHQSLLVLIAVSVLVNLRTCGFMRIVSVLKVDIVREYMESEHFLRRPWQIVNQLL